MKRCSICYVVSSEMTVVAFLRPLIARATTTCDIAVAANTVRNDLLTELGLQAELLKVPIARQIRPFQDLVALWSLYRIFRVRRFQLVHSISPKAGLLGMLAAWLARVPVRVHTFTGQVWATQSGWRRRLLKATDRMLTALSTHPLVDSPSQLGFLIAEGVMPQGKAAVIGKGSVCGVDTERFRPDVATRAAVRSELGIPGDAFVMLFLGRLNRDKGILDLVDAFAALSARRKDCMLLLVGPDEGDTLRCTACLGSAARERVRHVDYTRQPERYMAAADIFCLPSYREGFGMAVLEAAAACLPAVASRIYGVTDAVLEGRTGLLHSPGDVPAIVAAIGRLADDPKGRRLMGEEGRARVLADFSEAKVTEELMAHYQKITAP